MPAEPEVEAETEVKPAEEAAPAEQVNGNVSEASAKVNGVAPAEEQATQPSSQSATPPPPETEAAPAPAPVADQSWADDQPETTTEVRFNPPFESATRVSNCAIGACCCLRGPQ